MKKNIKGTIIIGAITVVTIAGIFSAKTIAANTTISSQGRIEFTNGNDDPSDDVIFDADDLVALDTMVTTGKEKVATAINEYPMQALSGASTFDELANGISSLTTFTGDYYYDKKTEGAECVRYIKEGESYFQCDVNGNKISETALSGTITIVSKEDTTEPAEGEIHLVKYTTLTDANISAGAVGFADKSLILGSGSDNINYRNLGFSQRGDVLKEEFTVYTASLNASVWNGTNTTYSELNNLRYTLTSPSYESVFKINFNQSETRTANYSDSNNKYSYYTKIYINGIEYSLARGWNTFENIPANATVICKTLFKTGEDCYSYVSISNMYTAYFL